MFKLFDRQLVWLFIFLAGCAGGPNDVHVPGEQGSMPVISNLVFTKTESTIVATWTTDVSADSNLTAGGKAAIDNGVAANSTSHQAIVTGLLNNSTYSCIVTSGGTSSSPQNVTTNAAPTRIPIRWATNGVVTTAPFAAPSGGDSIYTFVSSDNITYATMNDGFGFTGSDNAGANLQVGKFTNDSTLAGANVNIMSSYLGFATQNGTDGPGGIALRGATHGPFGLNGRLFLSLARADNLGTFAGMGNVIGDNADHGASWNRYDIPSSFAANGQGPGTGVFEYAQNTYDDAHFVRYGADDGTLGYNSSGNQIDGANAYVYMSFKVNAISTTAYLMRWPRIQFNASNNTAIQYWIGPASPAVADFVNDANWSSSDATKTSILTTSYTSFDAIIDFVPAVNRYVLWYTEGVATHGTAVWHFYEAPTPAGPWTQFYTTNTAPNGWIAPMPMHRDLFTNVATDSIALRLLYSGDSTVPSLYKAHVSTITLRTTMPPPAFTFIQGTGTTTAITSATMSKTFGSNVAVGDLLVTALRQGGPAVAVNSVSDNMGVGNVWTVVYNTEMNATTHVNAAWAYTFSKGSGACTVSWNLASSAPGGVVCIGEWNGPDSVRSTPACNVLSTQTVIFSNNATATASDLLVGLFSIINGSATFTAQGSVSSFVVRATGSDTGTTFVGITDCLNANAGAQNAQATISGTQAGTGSGIGDFFAAGFSLSGAAGQAGATINYSGTASGSVAADGSGNFSIPTLYNGSYVITPSLSGFSFTPSSRSVNVVSGNVTGVNFTATTSSGGTFDIAFRGRLYVTRVVTGL